MTAKHINPINEAFDYFISEYQNNSIAKRWIDLHCEMNEADLYACFEEIVNVNDPYDYMVEDIDTFFGNFTNDAMAELQLD